MFTFKDSTKTNVRYFVNPEKNTVVAKIYTKNGVFTGKAKRDPKDSWDQEFGQKLALGRAEVKRSKNRLKYYAKRANTLASQIGQYTNLHRQKELEVELHIKKVNTLLQSTIQ